MKKITPRDVPMVARALREGWPISDEDRKDYMEQLKKIALGKARKASPRDRVRAIEAVLRAAEQNHIVEQSGQPAEPIVHVHQIEPLSDAQRADAVRKLLASESSSQEGSGEAAGIPAESNRSLPDGADGAPGDVS